MSPKKWMDFLLDDTAENQVETFIEEDNSELLCLLHNAKEWEEAGKIKDHSKEIEEKYVKLGKPTGKKMVHVFMGLKEDALVTVLYGAGALGRVLEGHDGITLFSLSIVFAYIAQFVKPKVVRSILVLCRLLFYKSGTRITGKFCNRIGCSKNRIGKALTEVMKNGLATPETDGNAPGSGRPPFKIAFAEMMMGYLMAVTGLDEVSLEKDLSRRHVEILQSGSSSDDSEVVTEVSTVDSITAAFNELKNLVTEVGTKTDVAIGIADRGHVVELERMKDNLSSGMADLGKVVEELATLKRLDQENDGETPIGDTCDRSPEEQARLDTECLKAEILPRFLAPIISLFTERCNGILEAFKESKGKNSYQLVKAAKRNAKPKSLANQLAMLWEDYRLILHDIETMGAEKPSEEATDQQVNELERKDAYDIRTVDVSELLQTVRGNLDIIIEKLSSASKADKGNVKKALGRLEKLKELLGSDSFQTFLSLQDKKVRFILVPMFCYLNNSCRHWLACWTEGRKDSICAREAADAILSERFGRGLASFLDQLNFHVQQAEEPAIVSFQEADDQNSENTFALETDATTDAPQKSREEAREAALHVVDTINVLIQVFDLSLNSRTVRKNSKESHIDGALTFLKDISDKLEKEIGRPDGQENAWGSQILLEITNRISDFLDVRLKKWEKDEEGKYVISYSLADRIAASLSRKAFATHLKNEWTRLEGVYEGNVNPGMQGRYVGIEETGAIGEWFAPDASLSPEARCDLVLKLWEQGKDPRKIETWIDYIISDEYNRNYGDPSDRMKCCRITRTELQMAFHCLTGMSCSSETLWTILTKVMGYTSRQCAKLDQVGEASKYRDKQYRHIKEKWEKADRKRTLVISVDTKAFLLLGRLKHDNGKIMCRKDGRVYRVFDHDFALKLRQIYPHGTKLVDPSRLDESAVLHPVGAYCPDDGTGYVALVLGKDTAESVCNLIRAVIDIKRKTRPELDTVLIMADGGGSNMANGVIWQSELLKLADDKNVTLDVVHFAPGSSKHNLIEHRMFSEISRNWKGRPFIDIEHVLGYINTTRNKSLTVQGWFDTRRYETNTEKKARGEKVMTRDRLNKEAGDRITHEFPDGEMYKWNYVVRPSFILNDVA